VDNPCGLHTQVLKKHLQLMALPLIPACWRSMPRYSRLVMQVSCGDLHLAIWCAILPFLSALCALQNSKIDLVVSGINRGTAQVQGSHIRVVGPQHVCCPIYCCICLGQDLCHVGHAFLSKMYQWMTVVCRRQLWPACDLLGDCWSCQGGCLQGKLLL
jgi:hypothetical protein